MPVMRLIDDQNFVAVYGDLLLDDGGLDGVGGGEDLVEFFKGTSIGFDTEEEPEDGFDNIPSNEDEDEAVLNALLSDGYAVKVDERDAVDDCLVGTHTLTTAVGVQAFDGVKGLQWGIGERVGKVEQEV